MINTNGGTFLSFDNIHSFILILLLDNGYSFYLLFKVTLRFMHRILLFLSWIMNSFISISLCFLFYYTNNVPNILKLIFNICITNHFREAARTLTLFIVFQIFLLFLFAFFSFFRMLIKLWISTFTNLKLILLAFMNS